LILIIQKKEKKRKQTNKQKCVVHEDGNLVVKNYHTVSYNIYGSNEHYLDAGLTTLKGPHVLKLTEKELCSSFSSCVS
jgi:hypothetical protein